MVPSSFSRVMVMEVIMADTSISISVITPGTNRNTPFREGLYTICTSAVMVSGSLTSPVSSCWYCTIMAVA